MIKDKIEKLQTAILIHSLFYYNLDTNFISDHKYDDLAKELYNLIIHNQKIHKTTRLYYVFYDYNASTGFDLYTKLDRNDKIELIRLAKLFLDELKRGGKNNDSSNV